MRIKYRLLSLVVLSCLAGCKKDVPVTDLSPIIIGEPNERLTIITYDKAIQVANSQGASSYTLNMDNDYLDDLEFSVTHFGSLGGINIYSANVKVLNPTLTIAATDQIDSVFLCTFLKNDTVFSKTYYTPKSGFVCGENSFDTLSFIERYLCPTVYSKGQSMPSSTIWADSSFYLSDFENTTHGWMPIIQHSVLLGNWYNTQLKYLVFKITTETETRYGWVQLSMNQHYQFEIHGYAIQK